MTNGKKKSKIFRNKEKNISYRVSRFHTAMRGYMQYRLHRSRGMPVKAPFTLRQLDEQERDINRLRAELGKTPIKYMREFRKTLKHI